MSMAAKVAGVAAAAFGALGSLLLYVGAFGLEAPTVWMTDQSAREMTKRNKRRLLLQRTGLVLLMISFTLGGVSIFL
jgi:hypothetical protein